jgi:hypothetical protein
MQANYWSLYPPKARGCPVNLVRHSGAIMAEDRPRTKQGSDGSLWLHIAPDSPLGAAVSEVEVTPERQRWMAAPEFSRNRYVAKPVQRKIGLLRALAILVRDQLRPRDDIAERLRDIEELIITGHNDAADTQIEKLRADYPTEAMKARVLGLTSLNLYDRGNEGKALYIHEFALLCGTAHPAMIEIFGESIRGPNLD